MYNRWMPVQYSSELCHHGVKGMKWGKHLFGKGVNVQGGASGGGGGLEDDELNIALEKYKKGEITEEELNAVYKKIQSLPYRLTHEPLDVLNSAAVKTIHAVSDVKDAVTHPGETASSAVQKSRKVADTIKEKVIPEKKIKEQRVEETVIPEKKIAETVIKDTKTGTTGKGKSFYEQNKDKMSYKVGDRDADAWQRHLETTGAATFDHNGSTRKNYRQNGKYQNMNLTDVYGENAKHRPKVGKDGADLYKDFNVSDVRNGINYSTREHDKTKYHDGKYGVKDKIREKVTGKADPDNLKQVYNDAVKNFDRSATGKHAWSVGIEEEHVRNTAAKKTDKAEQAIYDKSLAGLISRKKKKRR